MTGQDNFIRRWARLKRTSDSAHEIETVSANAEVTTTQPEAEEAPDQAFDPASLPSLESIAADTDIGAFLQSGVPAELTRAALRRAWASDPAIRDFIGIAENQWDFNDPDGYPDSVRCWRPTACRLFPHKSQASLKVSRRRLRNCRHPWNPTDRA